MIFRYFLGTGIIAESGTTVKNKKSAWYDYNLDTSKHKVVYFHYIYLLQKIIFASNCEHLDIKK